MRIFLFTTFLVLYTCTNCWGQLSRDQIAQIDKLFEDWQAPNHPGGSIGIMHNEQIVYLKAYGLASLEYQIPNNSTTLFNVASVSKQFTAMGIVLLSLKGKIDIDENINTYLPNMPEFEFPVTLRQMLHHTSGLRSLHAMLELAGWRKSDLRTNEDLYRFMEKQNDLNFKPNDEYLYCNTGYMLMSKIIESLTGEKFSSWMKKNVFEPLGMSQTYVEGKYNRVVLNNATSYYKNGNTYDRSVEYWGYVGSGNVHTTAEDLLKWLSNFNQSQVQDGWEEAFKMIQTLDVLNNGLPNNYAFGVNIDSLKGHRRIHHGGSIGGFRALSVVYPKSELSIAILTNFSNSNPKKIGEDIFEIILPSEEKMVYKSETLPKHSTKNTFTQENIELFQGNYWSSKALSNINIKAHNDSIRIVRDNRVEGTLIFLSGNLYMSKTSPTTTYQFDNLGNEITAVYIKEPLKDTIEFKKYDKTLPAKEELKIYEGRYYSDELETSYDIYVKDDNLYSHHPRHGDFKIEWIKDDILKGEYPFSILEVQRDDGEAVSGLKVSNGRVKRAWFKKSY